MTITLPDEMRDELERKAKAGGFATVDEYVADVLMAGAEPVAVPDPPAGARYAVGTREELTQKLLEGTDTSGDVVAGPDFWEQRFRAAGPTTAELADAEGGDIPVPDELRIRDRADLEAKLLEGLNSGPPIRVTPEFWKERKRMLAERMVKRKGESA